MNIGSTAAMMLAVGGIMTDIAPEDVLTAFWSH